MRQRQPYPKDYGTHVPILIATARLVKVKSVLEFGAGLFSTRLFLDHRAYPSVEKAHTCEKSQDWIDKVVVEIKDDRYGWSQIDVIPEDTWDIVFADSATEIHKAGVIEKCSDIRQKPVVIHDSEVEMYSKIFENQFKYFYDFEAFEPCTAIAWNQDNLISREKLLVVDALLEKNCFEDPTDVSLWVKIFDEGLKNV